jgi:hypothetical protein
VKQKLGILQRLMMKLQGCWLSMGLNCWIIDFVYFTTDIVSEYKFNLFLLCFLAFWFLTINHAAMRTAIPAFVYSLSLNVQLVEKKIVLE